MPAVMLQHGLMASSDTWIANKDELAPAFRLAREGFDVWLGNNRGNKFSRHHRSINPDRNPSKFFDFSFEDLANYGGDSVCGLLLLLHLVP